MRAAKATVSAGVRRGREEAGAFLADAVVRRWAGAGRLAPVWPVGPAVRPKWGLALPVPRVTVGLNPVVERGSAAAASASAAAVLRRNG